jgi:hypothetical protein
LSDDLGSLLDHDHVEGRILFGLVVLQGVVLGRHHGRARASIVERRL